MVSDCISLVTREGEQLMCVLTGDFLKLFFNVYLFGGWGVQRETHTHNPKQAPGSELLAQSLTWGSNSQSVRSLPEPK